MNEGEQKCTKCGCFDCSRIPYENQLLFFYQTLDNREDLNNNKTRFMSYGNWTQMYNGVLGRRVRITVPDCVKKNWYQISTGKRGSASGI